MVCPKKLDHAELVDCLTARTTPSGHFVLPFFFYLECVSARTAVYLELPTTCEEIRQSITDYGIGRYKLVGHLLTLQKPFQGYDQLGMRAP